MKTFILSIIILILCSLATGGEITIEIDQIVSLTPPEQDRDSVSSRIALHFALPDSIENKTITYGELIADLDFSSLEPAGDATMDIQARNITTTWEAETANWDNLASRIDTLSFYSYTFNMAENSELHMDVTEYIRAIGSGRSDFGLMLMPYKFFERSFHMSQSILAQLGNTGRLRIVYDNF